MQLTDEVRPSDALSQAMGEAGVAIARQLNEPLTTLLLYISEIKLHSHEFTQAAGNRIYLQQVILNAIQQTERLCVMMKQIENAHEGSATASGRTIEPHIRADRSKCIRTAGIMFYSDQKPLTKREREVLNLISEGYSNKQGALRMHISPRTFESHRSEVMRKFGARNTADLVRTSLLHPGVI